MDKYTIDLDKLLNDFEYSELTEQQSNIVSSNCQNSQSTFPLSYQTNSTGSLPSNDVTQKIDLQCSKAPMTSQKHSINNVFHSLNEYLNSDIKTDLNTHTTSLSNIQEIEADVPSLIRKSSKERIEVPSIQDIFKNISKDETIDTSINLRSEVAENTDILISNLNDSDSQIRENITEFPIDNNIELKLNLNNIPDNSSSSDIYEEHLETADTTEIKFNSINTSQRNENSEISAAVKICTIKPDGIAFIKNDLTSPEIFQEPEVLVQPVICAASVKTDQYVSITQEKTSKILNINDDSIEVMILEQPVAQVQSIKFEDSIDLSDTEIQNELEQLEKEYQNKLKSDNHCEIQEEFRESENQEHNLSDSRSAASNDDCNNYGRESEKAVINSENNETENMTVNYDKDANNDCIIKNELNESICHENEDIPAILNTNSDVLLHKVENIEPSIIIVESAKSEIENEKLNEEHINKQTERKNSFLLRPNSLDLNSEAPNESLTINLIGNPGSTPYNNVYVSLPETTENPKNNPNPAIANPEAEESSANLVSSLNENAASRSEAENEINNSLSPTLSESSSYDHSNTDSPNTSDSCNDTSIDDTSNENTPKNTSNMKRNINNQQEEESTSTSDQNCDNVEQQNESGDNENNRVNNEVLWLGKTAPFWTPDTDTLCCLHCNLKFTVIKRRHHCRACGLVLCSKCCSMKCKLQYMDNQEARVCTKCYETLTKDVATNSSSGSETSPENRGGTDPENRQLNPNNPMEYCSTVPPLQQVSGVPSQPPSVMVPVGVLKRKGSGKNRSNKSVMFMDGIRPGCDLTELDTDFNYKQQAAINSQNLNNQTDASNSNKKIQNQNNLRPSNRNLPKIDPKTSSYIPAEDGNLPPIVNIMKSDIFYADCSNNNSVVEMLRTETVTFAIQRNFHVQVRISNMDCCINKHVWCFSTDGMISVGQDEIIILLEFIDNERTVPKDIFLHLNNIFNDAVKGTSITELGLSIHPTSNFLESKNHAGFLYIKPTFQCIQNVLIPKEPYLLGLLIHRWETPWAKIFPLRLLLRLGAEYRYYPSPIISTRHRESVYVEIGHTIINLLADFRNFSYTIPSVRGLTIHMEDKNTTVSIPMNRYDQVMKALNNSSDHILAFAANFSPNADSHLVCIQDTHGNNENAYTTHAINIHNKPRKITGASFIVLNGALKSSSGLTAKSSIIEDGLMIQILPEQMLKLRNALKNMKNFKINCGCVNAQSDESVSILWIENDINFNVGVVSPIDNMSLSGIPSIRVHNGKDFVCNSGNKLIRWTEVFIIQSGEEVMRTQEPVDISKISESISKGTSQALVKYLDLLATNSCTKIGIRTTLHIENVSYLAGSNGTKLPPIYMKSLDNELIPVLHKITSNFSEQASVVLELKFHILNV